MVFGKKKFKIFYVLENESISSRSAKAVNNLEKVNQLIDKIKNDYFIGVYLIQERARVLIKWNKKISCYNFESSYGDDGLFKNVNRDEAIELLANLEDAVKLPHKYGFTEDQAPWKDQ